MTTIRAGLFSLFLLLFCQQPIFAQLSDGQLHQLGVEAYREGKMEQAVDYLRRAFQSQPYDHQLKLNFANVLLAHGHHLLQKHRYEAAAEIFFEGQEVAPDNPRFWLYRGHALLALGEYSQAEIEVNEALGMAPDNPIGWQLLGRIYYDTGRIEEAVSAWEDALERNPGDQQLETLLAKTRRELVVEQEMSKSYAASFIISYDGDRHEELGPELLSVLDEAYIEVGSNLDHYPQGQVPVLVYTHEDFSRITASPGWAAGLYDGKIRIPLGGVKKVSPTLRALLFHEYTHVAVRSLSRGQCPTWFNEGLAEVVARSQADPPLRALEGAANLYPFAQLKGTWSKLPVEKVRLAYEQSYSFVNYLIDYYGWHVIGRLLRGFSSGAAEEQVFLEVFSSYGLGLEQLQDEWQRSLGRG